MGGEKRRAFDGGIVEDGGVGVFFGVFFWRGYGKPPNKVPTYLSMPDSAYL